MRGDITLIGNDWKAVIDDVAMRIKNRVLIGKTGTAR